MNLKFMCVIIAAALLLSAISGCVNGGKKTIPVENKIHGNLTTIQSQIINEDDAKKHNSNGLLLAEENRFSEAEMEFREAIKLSPNFAEAHSNLGSLLAKSGRYDEAEKEF